MKMRAHDGEIRLALCIRSAHQHRGFVPRQAVDEQRSRLRRHSGDVGRGEARQRQSEALDSDSSG